jgi:hypothetical protein
MLIKFRGWDTVKKVMYSPEEMGRDELTINPDGRGFVNVHGGSTKLSEYYSHILPLQYIGYNDTTNKEIYCGDVIEYENSNSGYGRPRHEELSRSTVSDITNYEYISDYLIWWKSGKIIGNIFENPELLTIKGGKE